MKKIFIAFLTITTTFGIASYPILEVAPVFAATYTSSDVSAHNTAANCWIILSGKVYNLTAFVSSHSGGSSPIISRCGQDGTALFNSYSHSGSATTTLASYLLGDLATTTAPVLTSVSVAPSSALVNIAATQQFTASPKDQNGTAFAGATITWSSSNTAIATVNATGLITAVGVGTSRITAQAVSGTKIVTGSSVLTVSTTSTSSPFLSAIKIFPPTKKIKVGKSKQFTAYGFDQFGKSFTIPTGSISWSISTSSVGTISGSGLFTATSTGTSIIKATSGNISGSAVVIVKKAPKNSKKGHAYGRYKKHGKGHACGHNKSTYRDNDDRDDAENDD